MEYLFTPNQIDVDTNALLGSDRLQLRPLNSLDFDKGFLKCLEMLTVVGEVTKEQFMETFLKVKETKTHFIIVIEDLDLGRVVACGTVVLEQKFIHSCSKVGHIEDIVIDESYRGKNLGKCIIEQLKSIARINGCYKVILDCAEKNQGFYEKLGFKRKEIQMAHYFE